MTWNPKTELVKKALKIAREEHENGFNKAQLIEASKKVYGGFGANPSKAIKTMEDVSNAGNAMAHIDGHYPVGMSSCFVVGINGGCGYECPVFLSGDCDEFQEEMLKDLLFDDSGKIRQGHTFDEDEIAEIFEAVGEDMQDFIEHQNYLKEKEDQYNVLCSSGIQRK